MDDAGTVVQLVHHTVPVEHSGRTTERAVARAATLGNDPAEARQAYRSRVIERTVELIAFDTARFLANWRTSAGT